MKNILTKSTAICLLFLSAGCKSPQIEQKEISAIIVERFPLVYPEWEYGTDSEGCPYRYGGIKVSIKKHDFAYIVCHIGDMEELPNVGSEVMIKEASLPPALIGTLDDMSVYHASELNYREVICENHVVLGCGSTSECSVVWEDIDLGIPLKVTPVTNTVLQRPDIIFVPHSEEPMKSRVSL